MAILNSTSYVFFLLFIKAFATTHPTSMHLSPTPLYAPVHWSNIIEFHEKSSQPGENHPLSTCQFSGTKANIKLSIIMLSE